MQQTIAHVVGLAWLAWCLFHTALLFASPYLAGGAGVVTNGFATVFPQHIRDLLTAEEQSAVMAHERGHQVRRHALKNLLRTFFFMGRSHDLHMDQEIEADDYAASLGHAKPLASALRKLSFDPFDRRRANRLDPV